MKKYIIIICLSSLYLSGCTWAEVTNSTSNDLVEINPIDRIISAADVSDTKVYNFAISTDIKEGLPTFKSNDKLTITANDSQEYSLFYSTNKDYDISALNPTKFTTYLNLENPKEGYYTLTSNDKNIDTTISVL